MKLPDYPQKGRSVEQTIRELIDYLRATTITNFQGGQMKQSRAGTTLSVRKEIRPKIQPPPLDPFFPILKGNEDDGLLLTMQNGYVILRKKKGSDAMAHIVPSDLPDDLLVAVGDKFTLKIEEDTEGEFATAAIVKTSGTWPESTAPDLDATTTSGGVRHIRLCEIIKETDVPEVRIWSTGHVDHFAPTIIENLSGGSEVLKEYSDGKWLMRSIVAGDGISITQNADTIEIASDTINGWWGKLRWQHLTNSTDTDPYDVLEADYEAGILKEVRYQGPGSSMTVVTGTQLAPGEAEFTSFAE